MGRERKKEKKTHTRLEIKHDTTQIVVVLQRKTVCFVVVGEYGHPKRGTRSGSCGNHCLMVMPEAGALVTLGER